MLRDEAIRGRMERVKGPLQLSPSLPGKRGMRREGERGKERGVRGREGGGGEGGEGRGRGEGEG